MGVPRRIKKFHLVNAEGRRFGEENDDGGALIYKKDWLNNPNRMLAQDIVLFFAVVDAFLWKLPNKTEMASFFAVLSPEQVRMANQRIRYARPIIYKRFFLILHRHSPGAFLQAKEWLDKNHENLNEEDLIAQHRLLGETFVTGVEGCLIALMGAKLAAFDVSFLFDN